MKNTQATPSSLHVRRGVFAIFSLVDMSPWLLAPGILLLLQASLLSLTPLLLVFGLVDHFVGKIEDTSQHSPLSNYIHLTIFALGLAALLAYAGTAWCGWVATRLIHSLRKLVAARLVDLSLADWMQCGTSTMRQHIEDNFDLFHQFIAQQLPATVRALCLPLILIAAQLIIDWRLALVSLLPILLVLPLIIYSARNKSTHKLKDRYYQSRALLHQRMVEFFSALPAVKSFRLPVTSVGSVDSVGGNVQLQANPASHSLLEQGIDQFAQFMYHWIAVITPPWARFYSFLNNASLPLLALGVWLYQNHSLTASTLLVFALLGSAYIRPLFALANTGSQMALTQEAIRLFCETINNADNRQEDATAVPRNHAFSVQDMCYSWGDTPLFERLSFTLPESKTIALVGPSGSGKSTLALLLAGVLQPTSGKILLGDADLATLPSDLCNQHIALVMQSTSLLAETLKENVALEDESSSHQVYQSMQAAQLGELLSQLPDGIDTDLRNQRSSFSGGESQRIQLARAIYKQAPVVILDEATAFCDADNEHAIQQAITELSGCRSLIVITHRLATVQQADLILLLNKGKLEAMGRHGELLKNAQLYAHLWQAQNQ